MEAEEPSRSSDFNTKTKGGGGEVTRRLNIELLSRFPWLAVSRHQEHEGLWCSVCVIMRISNSGGGWSALSGGGGQKMGRLVLEPPERLLKSDWKRWCTYKTCQFTVSYESPV